MNKNILIRNLTEKQNERLLLLQKKFGVKTNTQAMLLLLRYCVILDDELSTLIELYYDFGLIAFAAMQELDNKQLDSSKIKELVNLSIQNRSRLEYLLNLRK
jgi:hypothetical protein